MKRLANYAISIITAIVTLVTFIGFLASKSLASWTRTHSEVVFYGLIFFFLASGVLLNYFFAERKRYQRLSLDPPVNCGEPFPA
jgi:hypothetical protein